VKMRYADYVNIFKPPAKKLQAALDALSAIHKQHPPIQPAHHRGKISTRKRHHTARSG